MCESHLTLILKSTNRFDHVFVHKTCLCDDLALLKALLEFFRHPSLYPGKRSLLVGVILFICTLEWLC